jgi:hypothetical protein
MAVYKMADVKVNPRNDFPLGLMRSHMVVIHLFLMLCDLQMMVRDLCPTLYITRLTSNEIFSPSNKIHREVGRAKDLSAPLYKNKTCSN